MDKRILESVKEFYKNVKDQEFFPDIMTYMEYSSDEQEGKNPFNF